MKPLKTWLRLLLGRNKQLTVRCKGGGDKSESCLLRGLDAFLPSKIRERPRKALRIVVSLCDYYQELVENSTAAVFQTTVHFS